MRRPGNNIYSSEFSCSDSSFILKGRRNIGKRHSPNLALSFTIVIWASKILSHNISPNLRTKDASLVLSTADKDQAKMQWRKKSWGPIRQLQGHRWFLRYPQCAPPPLVDQTSFFPPSKAFSPLSGKQLNFISAMSGLG